MKTFHHKSKVYFADVDPAGIMFYPRIFEMVNETIEEWFSTIGFPFSQMHLEGKSGVPLASIEAKFKKPNRLGETLDFVLRVGRVGNSSLELKIEARAGEEERFSVKGILAHVDLKTKKATPWPENMKTELLKWQVN